ncbi:MAG: hypothetical protein KDD82_27850 [Planctomycetes bacterium]|nr:hypothetical protein [Planctomycetota bacterium]
MERLSKERLLEAVAGFLAHDVASAVGDAALAFRLKIAANLLSTIAAESRVDEALELDARERLRGLVAGVAPRGDGQEARRAELSELEAALCAQLRAGTAPPEEQVRAALREVLGARLALVNPRFERSLELP